MDRWKRPWAQLAEAVRQGAAVDNQAKWLGEDPQFMRDFILGMHQFAARSGPQFAEALKDLPVRRLIDVGGGAGTYSIALCAARPEARAEILDLAPVVDITRETARAAGLADRVTARVADYRHDEFGADADALLFSNVLHQESAEVCRSMLARALRRCAPAARCWYRATSCRKTGARRSSPPCTTCRRWRCGTADVAGPWVTCRR